MESVDRAVFAKIRAMQPEERLRAVSAACLAAHRLLIAGPRQQYPDADENELLHRAAARRLGKKLLLKMFGPEAEVWLD